MNDTGTSVRRILTRAAYGGAVVMPLLILVEPATHFPEDWSNHLWMIGYYGDYFRAHGTLPTVMNTAAAVGLAQTVFYAWLVYPMLGVIAALVGAASAMRLVTAVMVAIQFFAVLSAGRRILGQPRLAFTVAVSVIWATYSLTNLYNRGALAEYLATGFFVTALAFGASALTADDAALRRFHGWLAGFFLVLTAGTHPPTAVLAAAFLVLLAIGGMVSGGGANRRSMDRRTRMLAFGGLLGGAVVLAPWVYVTGRFASGLSLVRAGAGDLLFCLDKCDSFWGRCAPFPYDASATEDGIHGLGVAYLEAPINFTLLVLLLWNLELFRRSATEVPGAPALRTKVLLALSGGWFLFLTALSLSPALAGYFHFLAPYVQYAYRLVSHCNAALLVAVFASGAWVARQGAYRRHSHQTSVVVAVCLTVAAMGLLIKLQHAGAVVSPAADRPGSVTRRQREVAPAYTLPGPVRELSEAELRGSVPVSFPVGEGGADFGDVGAISVNQAQAGWVRTNALVFPWLDLESDARVLTSDQLARTGPFLAAQLPAGRHELRAVWRPDATWSVLNRLSRAVFALALLFTLGWAVKRRFRRHGAAAT